MNVFQNYIVVVIVVFCSGIGYILKNLVTSDKINKFIPLIVGTVGIIMNTWLNSFRITPDIITSGLISGLASTGMYELFKNFIEKPFEREIIDDNRGDD